MAKKCKPTLPFPDRRQIISGAGGILGVAALRGFTPNGAHATEGKIFTHGIASGDPLQDRVILWTRAVPKSGSPRNLTVTWEVSKNASFDTVVSSGNAITGPKTDYTVKVDATGLMAGQSYYYRFICDGETSPLGHTKTLPSDNPEKFSVAVVSCSNYPQGYFHVYNEIANREYDAVLHLGDYIYEYPDGGYSNKKMVEQHGRAVMPKGEVIALDDYRTRYALYRSDPDLQAVHAAHPFICVWDDHEVANDTWKSGAQNHNEGEGLFEDRKTAALRAYHEWLPIRENPKGQDTIYRSFHVGNLATFIMLDTRITGRDKGLEYSKDLPPRTMTFNMTPGQTPHAVIDKDELKRLQSNPDTAQHLKMVPVPFKIKDGKSTPILDWETLQSLDPKALPKGTTYLPDVARFRAEHLHDEKRTMLGKQQEQWLENALKKSRQSNIPWQIIGQQVLTGKVGFPNIPDEDIDMDRATYVTPDQIQRFRMLSALGMPLNLDAWDGYPAARNRLFGAFKSYANNVVTLAGDTHNAWAFNMKDDDDNAVAVEFATAGVSSPGLESYLPVKPAVTEAALMAKSPELQYIDGQHRGWLELAITKEEVAATWQFVSTVHEKNYTLLDPTTKVTKTGKHIME